MHINIVIGKKKKMRIFRLDSTFIFIQSFNYM